MKDRIKQVVDYSNLSTRAFAIRCGLKQNTFSNQLNGVYAVTLSTIEAIIATFPEISAEWLMRGTSEMLIATTVAQEQERIKSMTDTIAILTETIHEKDRTIATLQERIKNMSK